MHKDLPFGTVSDKEITKYLNHFCTVIEDNIDSKDLKLFNQNISTLIIEKKSAIILNLLEKIFTNNYCLATYRVDKNTISIIDNSPFTNHKINQFTLYHELLHAASSFAIPKEKLYFSGFSIFDEKEHCKLGDSINEGYTELLNRRLFGSRAISGYEFEIIAATLIEQIVDNHMTSFYFHASLDSLIEGISIYGNQSDTKASFEMLDYISQKGYKKIFLQRTRNNLQDAFEYSIGYLVESYIEKLENNLNLGLINENDFYIMLKKVSDTIKRISFIDGFLEGINKKYIIKSILYQSGTNKLLRELKK